MKITTVGASGMMDGGGDGGVGGFSKVAARHRLLCALLLLFRLALSKVGSTDELMEDGVDHWSLFFTGNRIEESQKQS